MLLFILKSTINERQLSGALPHSRLIVIIFVYLSDRFIDDVISDDIPILILDMFFHLIFGREADGIFIVVVVLVFAC